MKTRSRTRINPRIVICSTEWQVTFRNPTKEEACLLWLCMPLDLRNVDPRERCQCRVFAERRLTQALVCWGKERVRRQENRRDIECTLAKSEFSMIPISSLPCPCGRQQLAVRVGGLGLHQALEGVCSVGYVIVLLRCQTVKCGGRAGGPAQI